MTKSLPILATLLVALIADATAALGGQRDPKVEKNGEAHCRAIYRCNSNPYGHDYQGTICRIQLQQCLRSAARKYDAN